MADPFQDSGGRRVQAAVHNSAAEAIVVWEAGFTSSRILVRERSGGVRGRWSGEIPLGVADRKPLPIAAINAGGAGVVAFDRGGALVAFRRAATSARWTESGVVASSPAEVRQIALSDTGRAVIVRVVAASGCVRLPCVRTVEVLEQPAADAAWTTTTSLTTPPLAAVPDVATSRRGDVLVAWRVTGEGGTVVAARKLATDSVFEEPVSVSAPGGTSQSIAIADNGDAGVSWRVPNPPVPPAKTSGILVALRAASAGRWGPPSSVGSTTQPDAARVAIDADGNALVVWPKLGATGQAFSGAGAGTWKSTTSPLPLRLNNPVNGSEFYALDRIILEQGKAILGFRWSALGDFGEPGTGYGSDAYLLRARDATSGRWSELIPVVERDDDFLVAAAPNGSALLLSTSVLVRDLSLWTFAEGGAPAPLPSIRRARAVISGRRVVVKLSVTVPSVVWLERTKVGSAKGVVTKRPRRAGRQSIDLGKLPRGNYRLRLVSCNDTRGCSVPRVIAFRVR